MDTEKNRGSIIWVDHLKIRIFVIENDLLFVYYLFNKEKLQYISFRENKNANIMNWDPIILK